MLGKKQTRLSSLHSGFKSHQHGQAMVEYAVLLILIVTLIAGGAELGITAYNASKTSDAAKAGANTWANAVSYSPETLRESLNIDTHPVLGQNCDLLPYSSECEIDGSTTDIRPKLNSSCGYDDPSNLFNETLPIDITACPVTNSGYAAGLNNLLTYLYPTNTPTSNDYEEVCTTVSGLDGVERISECNAGNTHLLIDKTLVDSARSHQPIQKISDSFNRISLGDHDPARTDFPFRKPSCVATNGDANDYDNGLPLDGKIYLFNPLPIDITACVTDPNRGDVNGASILVGGYKSNINNALDIEGLPQLNQAIYSQYSKVCVQESAGVITVQPLTGCIENGFSLWLKPPGKICGADGGESCPGVGDLNGATGFYFFGHANDAAQGTFVWDSDEAAEFRPTFQIACNGESHRSSLHDAAGTCVALDGIFSLQVNVRYRSIFESFLTFGMQELADANLAQYFYDPNKVGTNGVLTGVAGAEIGPVGPNGRPTVKQFKDFRGCFHVDVTPPDSWNLQANASVSSCN